MGALTAVFAATIGLAQTDIKRAGLLDHVATGLHVPGLRRRRVSGGIFHLMTHAFFKGLLFLGAGSVIHAFGGEQDMRKMGGLRLYIAVAFFRDGHRHASHCGHSAARRFLVF